MRFSESQYSYVKNKGSRLVPLSAQSHTHTHAPHAVANQLLDYNTLRIYSSIIYLF